MTITLSGGKRAGFKVGSDYYLKVQILSINDSISQKSEKVKHYFMFLKNFYNKFKLLFNKNKCKDCNE